jgi:SAM-dependent methyltransferase
LKNIDAYDSHLNRLQNRPGGKIQKWLIKRTTSLIAGSGFKDNSTAIEIGPGSGALAISLMQKGVDYTAIEPTNAMADALDRLGGSFPNYRGVSRLALGKDFEGFTTKFDSVIAVHVLEHNSDAYSAREFLKHCHDLVVPGGQLVLICPDFISYKGLFYDVDWSHGYETTLPRVRSLLEDTGFSDIDIRHTRASFSNIFVRGFLCFVRLLIPIRVLDALFWRIFGHQLLATGFAVGFLLRNIQVIAKKE